MPHIVARGLGALVVGFWFVLGGCGDEPASPGGGDASERADAASGSSDATVDPRDAAGNDEDATTDGGKTPLAIQYGFNAKGSMSTATQTAYAATMLAGMSTDLRSRLHVRVTGGTRSQTEHFGDPWDDAMIDSWVHVQQDWGIGLVFVVNGNETPQNQLAFIQHWMARGAHFRFIEMMNEYYLPKFANFPADAGDPPEATRKVTAGDYVDEILPAFFSVLAPLELPYFVICAPSGKPRLDAWNDTMVAGLAAHPDWKVGVTVHLYDDGSGPFDYDQIVRLRARLPAGTPIAITEAGITNGAVTSYAQDGTLAVAHYTQIASRLLPGDFLFDQVLYLDHGGEDPATKYTASLTSDSAGPTAKGTAVVSWFETAP